MLNVEKNMKNEMEAKSLICFWLSYVVFLSNARKNQVFGSCFRKLAVILVSDFYSD